jgi:hypothetical protein
MLCLPCSAPLPSRLSRPPGAASRCIQQFALLQLLFTFDGHGIDPDIEHPTLNIQFEGKLTRALLEVSDCRLVIPDLGW